MMHNRALENLLNTELTISAFGDYAPNGLQVEGCADIRHIVTGVTACQALLDRAVALKADAIIVHHGWFWKNEAPQVTGMKHKRLKTLLAHDINLYAYHLPLDAHPQLGNNVQLAKQLGISVLHAIEPLIWQGEYTPALNAVALREHIEQQLGRSVLHCGDNAPREVRRIAWCTGGGQSFIQQAAAAGVDAFLSGEVSEQTIHIARETGMHFYAAGHHATERYGIKALGEWLAEQHQFDVTFVDIPNPA